MLELVVGLVVSLVLLLVMGDDGYCCRFLKNVFGGVSHWECPETNGNSGAIFDAILVSHS